jgi:hypothetical protein
LQPHELAIFYHEHGWPIFPCRNQAEEVADPSTGELITLNEKTPKTSNGFKGASKFRRIIDRWWSDWPDSAVGIPTGAATGVFVLDIDCKPGGANGFDWLSDMEAEHGPLPETARVTTPNGGLHIYFNYVVGTRNRGALGGGVDIRSEGGYVLAAGSQMSDGRAYEWSPVGDASGGAVPPIADAPEWLLALLLPKPSTATNSYHPSAIGNTPYVTAAIQSELDNLASTPSGGRNNRLNDAAFALGQFVGAGVLARSEAERELQAIAQPWGNFPKSCGTIRNGLNAGMLNPRAIPEPSFQEDNTRLVDVSRMIANGIAKGKAKLAAVHEDAVSEEVPAEPEPALEAPPPAEPAAANDNTPPSPILATAFKWIDPKTLTRREFAFGTHYIRKYVSVTVSPGCLGKTSNSIVEALSMTSGRSLSGTKPPAPLRVWIFNAEDPRDEMERRIMAACIHYNLTPKDLEGKLFVDTGREQELVVAIEDKRAGVKIQSPIVEAVCEQILANEIDVMIVDPFVSTHGVNENDNGAIDKVAKLWARIADYTNVSIDIVHHLRKVADREATVEDARGAVSLIGAARSVRVLNRMSEEQATQAGVPLQDRFSYFNISQGKSNLTKMAAGADWRKLESVPLGNGRGLTKPQDHAGVVTEWRWPTSEEVAGELSREQVNAIRTAVETSDYKPSVKAKNWVGVAVAYALGIDLEEAGARQKVGGIVKALMKEGVLTEKEDRDPVRRELAVFVRAA